MHYPSDQVDIKVPVQQESTKLSPAPAKNTLSFKELIADVERLKAILREETAAMSNMDIEPVKNVHDEKLRLVKKLELQQKLVKQNPSLFADKTPALTEKFRQTIAGMDDLLMENYLEALKAKEVNQHVLETVRKAIAKHQKEQTAYASSGYGQGGYGMQTASLTSHSTSSSGAVVVNQTI